MYLRVKFGDNDFGLLVELALRRIWKDIKTNNGHLIKHVEPHRSLSQLFEQLFKAGALQLMIELAVDCEYNYSNVEYATRGLYWESVDWERRKEEISKERQLSSITNEYLNLELSFHPNKKFAKEWANGEEAYLNLETGKVATY